MQTNIPTTPLVRLIPVTAAEPSLQDNTADIDRLKKALTPLLHKSTSGQKKSILVPYRQLNTLSERFRKLGFKGSAVVNILESSSEIVDFLPESTKNLPAIALDLGTTHLEATLINLQDGSHLGHSLAENRQIQFGADILSRIHYSNRKGSSDTDRNGLKGLEDLQKTIVETINDLTNDLGLQCNINTTQIRAICISGNTTMIHLLLGLNPYHICREPYIPLVNDPDPFHADEIGLNIHPFAPVWILPSIGSYFGGDLISGILTSGIDQREETSMLIDVGTNAEVVLGNSEWLIACAGAAGPALEGGIARMGMRAGPGAIEHVAIDTTAWNISFKTINNSPPAGICGSGMIDLVAELYLARIIDLRGKFNTSVMNVSSERKIFLQNHIITENHQPAFIVAHEKTSANMLPIVLSQVDLDAMMRSKAAMYAILSTLTNQVGIDFIDLAKIYVAGAFGKHIDPRQAITLGMLPDLPISTYESIGNSSLKGAELILLEENARKRSKEIKNKITYIELNVNQDFMIKFSGSRFIPHTDPKLFPSVPSFQD